MDEKMRILVCDSDHENYSETAAHLRRTGYDVELVSDPGACLATVLRGGCDLVLVNPLDAGRRFCLLRQLCDATTLPVIAVAKSADPIDVVLALELGADDFVFRSIDPPQLAARIEAVLRRAHHGSRGHGQMRVGPLTLNPQRREAWVEGRELPLTTVEFMILDRLIRSAGRPVSREDLIRQMYNRDATGLERSLAVHISHLRKKLRTDTVTIKTVWGVGYQLCPGDPEGQ